MTANDIRGGDRIKRLRMRCWRRGTREMDLILGPYADSQAAHLSEGELVALEALLDENDQDLYAWVSGRSAAPAHHRDLIERLKARVIG